MQYSYSPVQINENLSYSDVTPNLRGTGQHSSNGSVFVKQIWSLMDSDSEPWGTVKAQYFIIVRVAKAQVTGMQKQRFTRFPIAVESVTQDGASQTTGVGCMQPQLMGPACYRCKENSCLFTCDLYLLPETCCHFTVNRVIDLEGPVCDIQPERKIDFPPLFLDNTFQNGSILLFYLSILELD